MRKLFYTITVLLFINSGHINPLLANESNVIEEILKSTSPPPGVIIEIISGDEDFLKEQLPILKMDIKRLKNKFPDLPIAIVSHGKEQFLLTSKNSENYQPTHKLVQQLVEEDIEVHVCGTHASWYNVTPEDFPDYVDVSVTGPAQINDYEEMGYELIVVSD